MHMQKPNKKAVARFLKYLVVFLIVAGLAAALGILANENERKRNELEGIYQKTYFEALDGFNSIESRLQKVQASNSAKTRASLLNEIATDCEATETNLSTLTSNGAETDKVIKFVNQVGDYCKYLAVKQQSNGMTDDELKILDSIHSLIIGLRAEFDKIQAQIIGGNRFVGSFGKGLNFLDDTFKNLNSSSLEYPELIYDGPFSDGLNDRELKFLKDLPQITKDQAVEKLKKIFPSVSVETVTESESTIPSYCIAFRGEREGQAEISKKGGMLVSFNVYEESSDTLLEESEQIAKAEQFLALAGYADMKAVWVTNNNSTIYLNFAYEKDGRIYYPDLVKVKMNGETGEIVGLEAQNYLYNHTDRVTESVTKSESEAKAALSSRLTVKTARLTVIPTKWNTEVVCYEFSATLNSETYYVYVDADTLEEIRVMRVIEDDGTLIM